MRLNRGKTKVEFITFLNPEATEAVCEYLNWRNRKPTYKKKINDDDECEDEYYRGQPAKILKQKREWKNDSD
ncbi:MAG: hypothetical protein ACOCQD_02005 [archaeon]